MTKKKFIEENPHFQDLTPEEIRRKDYIDYLNITNNFKLEMKTIKKKKNAKI